MKSYNRSEICKVLISFYKFKEFLVNILRNNTSAIISVTSFEITVEFVARKYNEFVTLRIEYCLHKSLNIWRGGTHKENVRCLKTWEDRSEISAHARVWRNGGWFHQHNKHYNLHTKIYIPHACEAPSGKVSFTLNKFLILKVVKTSLISLGFQNRLASLGISFCAITDTWPMWGIL